MGFHEKDLNEEMGINTAKIGWGRHIAHLERRHPLAVVAEMLPVMKNRGCGLPSRAVQFAAKKLGMSTPVEYRTGHSKFKASVWCPYDKLSIISVCPMLSRS